MLELNICPKGVQTLLDSVAITTRQNIVNTQSEMQNNVKLKQQELYLTHQRDIVSWKVPTSQLLNMFLRSHTWLFLLNFQSSLLSFHLQRGGNKYTPKHKAQYRWSDNNKHCGHKDSNSIRAMYSKAVCKTYFPCMNSLRTPGPQSCGKTGLFSRGALEVWQSVRKNIK